jgi:EmrB/QacA subfamily drug resistance transporter
MTQRITDDAPVQIDHRARMEILGAILLTMFLSALDQTVVGTALPRIVTDLKGNELYVWVVTVYLLAATVTGPIYGKLSDLFGRRPMMMIGVSLFLAGSLLCGLSQEMWQLILFRGIQGLGAGAIFPIALAVIGDLFSPRERGKYQGLFGAVFALSSIIGPALGGFLTDTISWHWVFLVNLPIGIVALVVLWRLLPPVRHPEAVRSIDYLGAAVFTAGLVPLMLGLTNKQFGEWTDPQVGGLIAIGLLLGAVFVWVESRATEPILPLELFRNRTVTGSIIGTFLITFGFFGAIFFIPRWFQFVLGSSATESG